MKNNIDNIIIKAIEKVTRNYNVLELNEDDTLEAFGIKSILLFSFITELESSLNIEFNPIDISPLNFESISAVRLLIKKYVTSI
ncbi:acyl carrier protein [Listeria booriae]|uniref:acyl carrier protein n=1 Tax=Listeria booriae TaxID=1552123 RepID=UPI0016271D9E|nr:acyl carrier protein [Listeria booriae]MBC1230294.1 acyl carrier protein [Listeria booriae]